MYTFKKSFILILATIFVCSSVFLIFSETNDTLINEIEVVEYSSFPSGISGADPLKFAGGVYDEGSLWLIPSNANQVVKVDVATGEMIGFQDWPTGFDASMEYKFRGGVIDGDHNLWLVPCNSEVVIKLNTQTGEMTSINSWPSGFNANATAKFFGGVYLNGFVWLVPSGADRVVKIDTQTGAMAGYQNFPSGFDTASVKFFGGVLDSSENLWLVPRNANMVVKLDTTNGNMTGFQNFPTGIEHYDGEKFFGGVFDGEKYIWLVPDSANSLVRLDTANGEMTAFSNWPLGIDSSTQNKFSGGVFDGKNLWLSPQKSNVLVKFDTQSEEMTAFDNWTSATASKTTLGTVFDGENVWLIPHGNSALIKIANSCKMNITAQPAKGYAPNNTQISVDVKNYKQNATVDSISYFLTKTTDLSNIDSSNFESSYNASEVKETISTPSVVNEANRDIVFNVPTTKNGTYWFKLKVTENGQPFEVIDKKTIDYIYTPCFSVKGMASDSVLYSENLATPHGLPLEFEGSLITSPSLGFDVLSVSAKPVEGFSVVGNSDFSVTLNDIKYLTAEENTIVFSYQASSPAPTPTPTVAPTQGPSATNKPIINSTPRPTTKPIKTPTPTKKPVKTSKPTTRPTTKPTFKPIATPFPTQLPDSVYMPEATVTPFIPKPTETPSPFVPKIPGQITLQVPKKNGTAGKSISQFSEQDAKVLSKTDDSISYILENISNRSGQDVYRFMIIDKPVGLKLVSGVIPPFANGEGLTYSILYKTASKSIYTVLKENAKADQPQIINAPNEVITEIAIYFEKAPKDFALGSSVTYNFKILDGSYSNRYFTHWEQSELAYKTAVDELKQTLELAKSFEENEALKEAIAFAQSVLSDPYATIEQINSAKAMLENSAPTPLAGALDTPSNLFAIIGFTSIALGILLLIVILVLAVKKRKKKK